MLFAIINVFVVYLAVDDDPIFTNGIKVVTLVLVNLLSLCLAELADIARILRKRT